MLRLLLIDDNPDERTLTIRELRREFLDLQVTEVGEAEGFNSALKGGSFDIAITDYRLRWNDGLTVLIELKSRLTNCPVIMFTDSGNQEIAVEAMKAGLDDYIIKTPKNYARLRAAVRAALRRPQDSIRLRRAEAALHSSEQRLSLLVESFKDYAIFTLDSNGYINSWNSRAEHILGYKEAEIINQHIAYIFTPEERNQGVPQQELNTAATEGQANDERWHIRKDGSRFWASGTIAPLRDLAGNLLGFSKIMRDISERKMAEEALQQLNDNLESQVQKLTAQLQQSLELEATLKRITDKVRDSLDERQLLHIAMQELVFTLDLICCDTALYNLADGTSTIRYTYTASSNEGTQTTPSSVGCTVQMADFPIGYCQLRQGEYFQFCEITPDTVRSQVAILACPIADDQGVLGDLWLFNHKEDGFDELEIRLVQQVANQCAISIRQARLYTAATAQVKELEKLNALKDDFLSTISHELRTPITNMKMALQMLQVSPTPERQKRYLEILQAECARESELINDLLDLQGLEASSYPTLLDEAVSLQEMLPTIIEPFRFRIQQRQQTLQINLPPDLPTLVSNRASLEKILAELLNNACKYTRASGEIGLNVCYKSTEATTIFTISNSAEIPTDQLSRIFDKFYRVPNSDPWKQGGTGLGLALVRKLVEQLQGTISVDSIRGWTTFTIQLHNQRRA
ncbi:MAG TPA: PAS domain S-box protein [Leptolyngbyaceae cyanobacterium]